MFSQGQIIESFTIANLFLTQPFFFKVIISHSNMDDVSAVLSDPVNEAIITTINIHDADIMTEDWTYYIYILLTLLPVYLFFKLWMWMGWQLYVNN